MVLPVTKQALGIAPRQVSPAGEIDTIYRFQPGFFQSIGAGVEDVFRGNGSLAQDVNATKIEISEGRAGSVLSSYSQSTIEELRSSPKLSREQWEQSENFREGVEYYDGMTEFSAQVLAETNDDQNRRDFILSQASGAAKGFGIGFAFVTGLFEPKNLAAGIATSLIVPGAGAAIAPVRTLLKSANRIGKYKALTIRGGIEGGVAASIIEPGNLDSAKILQQDYGFTDSLTNFTLSIGLGALLPVTATKIRAILQRRRRLGAQMQNLDELDAAITQMSTGQDVDVRIVGLQALVDRDIPFTTLTAKQFDVQARKNVKAVKGNQFEVRLDDEAGAMAGAVGRGNTKARAIKNLRDQYELKAQVTDITGFDPELAAKRRERDSIKLRLDDLEAQVDDQLNRRGINPEEVGLQKELSTLEATRLRERETLAKDADDARLKTFDEETKQLRDDLQKRFAKAKGTEAVSDELDNIRQTREQLNQDLKNIDEEIKTVHQDNLTAALNEKLVNEQTNNSTAYDQEDIDFVKAILDEGERPELRQQLEQDVAATTERIEVLRQADQLDEAEQEVLRQLAKIDEASESQTAALESALNCLTRG